MKLSHRDEVTTQKRNSATTSSQRSSEYGQSVDWQTPGSAHTIVGRFVSPAYHSRGVTARSASGKALNPPVTGSVIQGLTGHATNAATLDDFATAERAETGQRPIRVE